MLCILINTVAVYYLQHFTQEPADLTAPLTDRKHFYWRASKTQSPDGNNDYVQLLSSQNDDSLTFSDNTPVMYTTKLS